MRAYELRPSVKSSLMIGAAGAAVTFGSATAFGDDAAKPPPSINKYLPYVQVGGTSGDSMSTGGVTMFIPAWQAFNQLLYVKVGGSDSGDGNFESLGLGYRQKIAPTWIVGAFSAFDQTHTKLGNDFSQFVFGGELLNPNWEFHGTAYVATDLNKIDLIKNSAKLEIDGNDIAVVRETEAPYSGFDGSGGYRVFKTPGTDGRLYAGGFYFKPSDQFDTKAIAGPKAGFEFNVYDLDFLGPQSRLQIQGEGRRDDVRKDSGYIGVNLRVPLDIGLGGQGAQVLDELDRRMVDDPQTTGNVLTHPEFNKPEPVVIYGTSGGRTQPTNTIFYVDNTTGRGTYPNPTTFEDATTRGGKNALIVITTEQGDVSGVGNLSDGDMVIGAGTTLTIKGSETGYKFTHTFAPGEHDAVLNVAAGNTAITLASNNALYNFAIHGSFDTAIAGNNIGTATIKNLTIEGDGSEGQKGIALMQDGSTPLDLLMTDTSVSGVGGDGISFTTHVDGAQTHNSKIEFDNVSVSNVGGDGITFSTEASGGAVITQNITLNNVSVSGAGNIGIGIAGFAEGSGSQLTQTATITDANVSNVTGTGIAIYGYTSGGGTLTQNVSIDPTTVNNSGYALGIGANAYGGTLNQTVNVDTLSGSGDNNGVEIYAYAGGGGTLNQTAMLTSVGFDAVGHDGVRIFAHSYGGAYINQGVEFDGLTLNGAGLYDLAVEAYADGGRIKQTALFNNLTINGSAPTAVDIFAEAGNGGESFAHPHFGGEGGESGGGEGGYYALIQNVMFNTASIHTTGNAFYAGVKTSNGDSASQYVSFSSDSSITSYGGGIEIYANASGGSLIRQQIHLPQVTLSGSLTYHGGEGGEGGEGGGFNTANGGGIRTEAHSYNGSTINSYTLIDSASITYAAQAGVSIAAYAEGGDINQTVKLNNTSITSYYATGISVYGLADGATLNQNALFDNVTVNGSGNPFTATAKSLDSGTANQYVSFTGDSALNSTSGSVSGTVIGGKYGIANQTLIFPDIDARGVSLGAEAYYGATTHQGASFGYILSSGLGLSVGSSALTNGTVIQNATVNNVVSSNEFGDGIDLIGLASADGNLSQYLTVDKATLTGDEESGFSASLFELNGGNALQMFSLSNVDTDHSGAGIVLRTNMVNGGTAEQDAMLSNISAQYESASGIALYVHSDNNAVQHVNIDGLAASHDHDDGIRIEADTHNGAVGQYVSVANATLTYDKNGVNIYVTGYGGTLHQQATLSNLTVNAGNTGAGLLLGAQGQAGANLYQAVTATNSHFDNNDVGISANNHIIGGASLHQGIGLYSSSADYNSGGGISIYTYASGANTIANNLVVQSSDLSHNQGRGGIYLKTNSDNSSVVVQSANIKNSTFHSNSDFGAALFSNGNGNGASYQTVVSSGNVFADSGHTGLLESASNSAVLEQTLSSTGDTFTDNYSGGIYAFARGGLTQQSISISGDTIVSEENVNPFFGNILLGATSNIAGSYISRSITNTTVSYGNGIELLTLALGGNVLNKTTISGTTVTHGGIGDSLTARYGGFADEYLTLSNDTISGSQGSGIGLGAASYGGTALQHVTADTITAYDNRDGLSAVTYGSGGIAAEYINISNSHFDNNSYAGMAFTSEAFSGGVTGQSVSGSNTSANGNATGVSLYVLGSGGSSNQYGHFDGVTVTGNSRDGIDASATGFGSGFAAQTVILTNTSDSLNEIAYNGRAGISVASTAKYGGKVEQNIGVYNTDISHNGSDGISLSSYASGLSYSPASIYYSHVSQNDIIGNDQITNNAGNGIVITADAQASARIDPFVYVYGSTITNNTKNGISETSTVGVHAQLYGLFYVVGSHVDNNTGAGFFEHDYATGVYSTNILTTELAGSSFNGNGGAGAYFYAGQNYGPGGFGATVQTITIANSTFDNNTGSGLRGMMHAVGYQGRAEQHFNISGSTFDYNVSGGISLSRYAGQGVSVDGYPCTSVQGVAGGCAFDRQTLLMFNSDVSHNAGDGIYIGTAINHYGAVYAQSGRPTYPTVYLNNTTVNANSANGLHLVNHVDDNSYLYQGVVAVGSHFDNNGGSGILVYNEASGGSTLRQGIVLDASSADYNAGSGIHVFTRARGAGLVYDGVTALSSDISHNGGYGVSMFMSSLDTSITVQRFTGKGSTLNVNAVGGVDMDLESSGDGIAYQNISSTGDTFSHNGGLGIFEYATEDSSSTFLLAQTLSSKGDTFDNNQTAGLFQYIKADNTLLYLYQASTITGATVTGGSLTGILIGAYTESANSTVLRNIANTTVSDTGSDGILLKTNAESEGRVLDNTTIDKTTVTNAGRNGIADYVSSGNGGFVDQYLTLTNSAVTGAAGNGVSLGATAQGGVAIQHATIDNLVADANGSIGLSVVTYAGAYSIAAQYLQISNSHFNNNSGHGAYFKMSSKYGGVGLQSVSISGSTANANGGAGLDFQDIAGPHSNAEQYIHLDGVTINKNSGDGILVSGSAVEQGFAAQTFILTGTDGANSQISGNSVGIAVIGNAQAGGDVEQGIGLYYANVTGNKADGVSISGNANGSIAGYAATYYSHVAQNVLAYHDSFSNNGMNGVDISNVASGGGQINSFAYFMDDKFDNNKADGLHVYSKAGQGSNVYDDIYIVNSDASKNSGNGITINSTAYGTTYLIQHVAVANTIASHNGGGENGGSGFVDNAQAQGVYSLNIQYVTLAGSQFDHNKGSGTVFVSEQTYGPGSLGATIQDVTIAGSDFSHNANAGLYAIAGASGNQGRAEQYFTVSNSQFDNNVDAGIHVKNYVSNGVLTYGTNSDGTYPITCDMAQGAYGGCAFVRQTLDISDSDVSNNKGDGIYVSTVLNHYAAIYNASGRPAHVPTIYLNNVTVDHNGGDGLHLTNSITDHSYAYQYVVAVNSHFDHNAGYGIFAGSGVSNGSSLNQKIVLASVSPQGGEGGPGLLSSVDGNGKGGIAIQTGASYAGTVSNALTLAYVDVSNNQGAGAAMHMSSTGVGTAVQSLSSVGSNFANNTGDGILVYSYSHADGIAGQGVISYGDRFTKNGAAGISATAIDAPVEIGDGLYTTGLAAQLLKSVGDHFTKNRGGISESANFVAPAVAYQLLYVKGDTFVQAPGTGPALLYSHFQSGSTKGQVSRSVLYSSFAGGEGNAVDFYTEVLSGGFAVDLTTISNTTIRNAGQEGVKIGGVATNGGTLYQSITMDGDHVSGSGGDGVYINATGLFGGKVIQDVAIDGLVSKDNGGDGLSLAAFSDFGGIAVQYAQISNSQFLHNGGDGISVLTEATGQFGGIAAQQISITNTQLLHNANNGFYMGAHADNGASIQQYALLSGVDASYNGNNGIRIAAYAQRQGFVAQGFAFEGTADTLSSIAHNGPTAFGAGSGVYISARAVFGGEIEQNSQIYNANISHNAYDGIKIIAYANGSYPGVSSPYYSHVSQNMAAGYGVIAHNGNDGVQILNTADPGAGVNQYLGFYYENISANGSRGIYEHSLAEAYLVQHDAVQTSLYSDIYVIGGNVSNNGGGGIDVRGYADGSTYLIQHLVVQGVHVDGNKGDGFSAIDSARGLYSLNIQYVTLAGSTFDHNTGNGARIYGHQFYGGYGGFGSARQYVTIQQSDFSHNGLSGLTANALSTDEQGGVEQDFTIGNSTFDHNQGDGISLTRTAENGTNLDGYPCAGVQGLYGGCAFVRQTVQISYSDVSHNTGDGIFVGTTASNYGAVYSAGGRPKNTPTILLYQTTVNSNGGDGLHLVNNASGGSDIYQYVVAVDSHFNKNAGYGVEAHNYITGGSTLFQSVVLYHYVQPDLAGAGPAPSMTVGNNGKGGVHIATYGTTGASVYEGLTVIGTQIGHNTGDGVNVSLNANGTTKAAQSVYVRYSDFVGNTGDGIHVNAYGLGGTKLSQTVTSENNYFAKNGGTGLYVGFTENGVKGASQHVTSYFDDFRQNGSGIRTNTDFIGGAGKLSTGVLIGFDNVHGGKYGIDVSLAASNGAHVTGFQKISYVGVQNTTGDGIDLSLSGDTNAKWSNTAQIIGNGVEYAGGNGIAVDFTLNNGAHLYSNPAYQGPGLLIQRNNVTGHEPGGEGGLRPIAHGHDGIYVGFTVGGGSIYNTGGERGHVPFAAVISNNTISYVHGDGIHVVTATNGGTLDLDTSIYNNTINYAAHGGIVVSHDQTAGHSNVSENIHGNHIYANNFFGGERGGRYGNEAGIEVTVNGTGGTIFDGASIYSNLTQGHDIGIAVETRGGKGTDQFADINGNQIYRDGTGVYGFAGGSSSQTVDYASNTLSSNGDSYYFNHTPGATQTLN